MVLTHQVDWCIHSETHLFCEYGGCKGPTRGYVIFGAAKHPLCDEHSKLKYHPPDLKRKVFRLP